MNAQPDPLSEAAAYQQSTQEVLAALATAAQVGLSASEAMGRLERHGSNELTAQRAVPAWRKVLAQFHDPLVILLLVATTISTTLWWLERDAALPYEAIAILAVVLLNAIMGYVQQSRAEQAVAALRQMSAAQAKVIRGGARQTIAATQLLPGDIILIEEGDTIPADARLIRSTALHTAEASLTGESLPVSKDPTGIRADVPPGDRTNMVFSGTAATYGRGKAVVTATGIDGALRSEFMRALAAADRANNAVLQERDGRWAVQGDPTEGALIVAARKAGFGGEILDARFERIGEVPFPSERKLMSTVHSDAKREEYLLAFTKGAPDVLLARCSQEQVGEERKPLTQERRAEILSSNEALAREALRTLAVALRLLPREAFSREEYDEAIESA